MSTMIDRERAKRYFASNLMRLMEGNGWTQADLARRLVEDDSELQSARMRVSRWCSGTILPDAVTLVNLAELFGATADDLLAPDKRRAS